MKFKNYLNESSDAAFLESFKKLKEFFSGDFSEAFEAHKKGKILYRGVNKEFKWNYIIPLKNRISTDGLNLYTPIINEHPSWKEFPKRNVICTTDYKTARQFGYCYQVFPKNESILGVCPRNDIWYTFGIRFMKYGDFCRGLVKLLEYDTKKLSNISLLKENPKNLSELKSFCDASDEKLKEIRKSPNLDVWDRRILSVYDFVPGKGLFDNLLEWFSSKEFKKINILSLKNTTFENEVWFDAPYILIDFSFLNRFEEWDSKNI